MALSDTKVRALKPRDKLYKVSDDCGLYLEVRPNGSKLWRYRYRLHDKDKRIALIATSASFSNADAAQRFIGGLVGRDVETIEVLRGKKHARQPSGLSDTALAAALAECRIQTLRDARSEERIKALLPLLAFRADQLEAKRFTIRAAEAMKGEAKLLGLTKDLAFAEEVVVLKGRETPVEGGYLALVDLQGPDGISAGRADEKPDLEVNKRETLVLADGLQRLVFAALAELPVVGCLVNLTGGACEDSDPVTATPIAPIAIDEIGAKLFADDLDAEIRRRATDALLELASYAKPEVDGQPLLAARVHSLFRGLPGLWATAATPSGLPTERKPHSDRRQITRRRSLGDRCPLASRERAGLANRPRRPGVARAPQDRKARR